MQTNLGTLGQQLSERINVCVKNKHKSLNTRLRKFLAKGFLTSSNTLEFLYPVTSKPITTHEIDIQIW